MNPSVRRRRRLLLRALCLGYAGTAATLTDLACAQAVLTEQQVKAAYVLNFLRYVDWPERLFAAGDSPLQLCVLGGDAGALGGIENKIAKGRPVRVRLASGVDEIRACHALYVPEHETRRSIPVLRSLQASPVLTIGESDGFIDAGGMIGLTSADNRLQFEINAGALHFAQLKASAQLLKLARTVIDSRPR